MPVYTVVFLVKIIIVDCLFLVTTGNGLCSLTVTAVCRLRWSLLATRMEDFPSPVGGVGVREGGTRYKGWDKALMPRSYLKVS